MQPCTPWHQYRYRVRQCTMHITTWPSSLPGAEKEKNGRSARVTGNARPKHGHCGYLPVLPPPPLNPPPLMYSCTSQADVCTQPTHRASCWYGIPLPHTHACKSTVASSPHLLPFLPPSLPCSITSYPLSPNLCAAAAGLVPAQQHHLRICHSHHAVKRLQCMVRSLANL